MDFSLSSLSWIEIALNLGLVAIAAVLVRRLLQPASPPESEIPPHPTDLPQRDFTLKELRRWVSAALPPPPRCPNQTCCSLSPSDPLHAPPFPSRSPHHLP